MARMFIQYINVEYREYRTRFPFERCSLENCGHAAIASLLTSVGFATKEAASSKSSMHIRTAYKDWCGSVSSNFGCSNRFDANSTGFGLEVTKVSWPKGQDIK